MLEGRLSIVLVTSPIGMNPETALVDGVISSFDLARGLEKCPLYTSFFIVYEHVFITQSKLIGIN